MNWLMYIGGGIFCLIITAIFISNILEVKKISNFWLILLFLAPLFIWAWFCWKFIR